MNADRTNADPTESLRELAVTLDALLRVRFSSDADQSRRSAMVFSILSNELKKSKADISKATSLDDLLTSAVPSTEEVATIRNRSLFYGCDDLIGFLANKRIRSDVIAREEAVLYVQDRLHRDDFRRIRSFQVDRGATFVTYIWQVINNLLLDYLRAHGKRVTTSISESNAAAEESDRVAGSHLAATESAGTESIVESQQLQELLAGVLANGAGVELHPLRERLRQHLKLSSKERVFLKALFQYDMTINEVCELPGFGMDASEAYRFYYRVMDQVRDAFKSAGLLDSMRALVNEAAPRVRMSIAGRHAVIEATRIYYLEQMDKRSTNCHAEWQGASEPGVIDESFNKLCKRLASYFTPITSAVAISDKLLTETWEQWQHTGKVMVTGLVKPFHIGARIMDDLKQRFAKKS